MQAIALLWKDGVSGNRARTEDERAAMAPGEGLGHGDKRGSLTFCSHVPEGFLLWSERGEIQRCEADGVERRA